MVFLPCSLLPAPLLFSLKREVSNTGVFPDIRKHRHFETPLQKLKSKAIAKDKQRKRSFHN
ncbi:30S ribosomal protein S21 [Nostoc sp. NZL]|nr:30S ribosomal protein S21 [Nostoc sp. NZL]